MFPKLLADVLLHICTDVLSNGLIFFLLINKLRCIPFNSIGFYGVIVKNPDVLSLKEI